MNFKIHIGTPRTATTTLQQQVFPQCKNHLYIGKSPFRGPGLNARGGISTDFVQNMPKLILSQEGTRHICDVIVWELIDLSCHSASKSDISNICRVLEVLVELASRQKRFLLFSSERLLDTTASLNGLPYPKHDFEFPIYVFIRALNEIGIFPQILVCFRNPNSYLISKFMRTLHQRKSNNFPDQSFKNYIESQLSLESIAPGSSVFSQVLQTGLVKRLQENAFVKAFGMKTLLNSTNIFATLGLREPASIAFKNLEKVHQIEMASSERKSLEAELANLLVKLKIAELVKSQSIYDCEY